VLPDIPAYKQAWQLSSRPPSSLDDTLARAERLISPRIGLIHRLVESASAPDEPPLFHCAATLAATEVWAGHAPLAGAGAGSSFDRQRARLAAICEAAERYAGSLLGRRSMLVRGSFAALRDMAVDPRSLPLGSEREYARPDCPVAPFHEDLELDWVWASSLTRDRPILVPAGCTFLPHLPARPQERLQVGTSSGLACAATLEEALLGGLLEVIERDAFLICWLNRFPLSRVNLDQWGSARVGMMLDSYRKLNIMPLVKQVMTDHGIPVLIAMLINRSGRGPAFALGACASLDPHIAVEKAMIEAEQARRWLVWMEDHESLPKLPAERSPESVQTRLDHAAFYADSEALGSIDMLISDDGPATDLTDQLKGDTPLDNLKTIVARLAGLDLEVLAVDLTSRDLAQVGLHVVRVIVPGLQPLYFGSRMRYLGSTRLYQVPQRLGFSEGPTTEDSLSPMPHPFL
jgi:ribosomal protein S12 methylthiotransferase accessory factor